MNTIFRKFLHLPEILRRVAWDMIAPPICDICQSEKSPEALCCPECSKALLPQTEPFCHRCGYAFFGHIDKPLTKCANCGDQTFYIDSCRSVYRENDPIHQLVLMLKYGKAIHLAPLFGSSLARLLESLETKHPQSIISFVPQSYKRYWQRGYNQAEEIARRASALTGIPCFSLFKRKSSLKSLTRLNRTQRLKAHKQSTLLRQKFYKTIPSQATHIFLVDDVITTGSTVNACAQALKKHHPHLTVTAVSIMRAE